MPGALLALPPFTPPMDSQAVDWDHPLSDRAAGCWLATERGGASLRDLAGGIGPIALQSGVTWSMRGVFGGVPTFDGNTAHYGSFSWASTTVFSVECWFYPTALPASGAYVSVLCESGKNGDSGSHAYGLNLFNFFGPTVVDWCGQFAHCRTDTGTSVVNNAWNHAVYIQSDANNGTAYLNAGAVGTNTNIQTPVGTVLARVAMGGENVPFAGGVGLVRIWPNRALTYGDVVDLATDPFGMLVQPLPRQLWFLGRSAAAGAAFIAPQSFVKSQAVNRSATY